METQTTNKVHNAVGVGGGLVGGILVYINSHLGSAFYALLLLIFLNVVAAFWEKDPMQMLQKMVKVIVGVSIPFVIPILAKTQQIGWNTQDTKTLVGLMFAALLSASVPSLLAWSQKVMSSMHIPQKEQTVLVAELEAELARLKAEASKNNQPVKTVNPVTPPNNNQGGQA